MIFIPILEFYKSIKFRGIVTVFLVSALFNFSVQFISPPSAHGMIVNVIESSVMMSVILLTFSFILFISYSCIKLCKFTFYEIVISLFIAIFVLSITALTVGHAHDSGGGSVVFFILSTFVSALLSLTCGAMLIFMRWLAR